MRSLFHWLLAATLHAFALLPPAFSADTVGDIPPPFGLNWRLAFERVGESVQAAGGRVVERVSNAPGEERWTVEGIAQDGLQRVLFTFSGGRLSAVELQYGKDEWDAQTYDDFMRRVRAGLDAEHGRGRLLVRERTSEPGVLKAMLGYSWAGRAQSVLLLYFSAQDQGNIFRLVSLHYSARTQRSYPQTVTRS